MNIDELREKLRDAQNMQELIRLMPRIKAGEGATPPDDTVITRVDITPEDIRSMSDEQLSELLARIRNQREAAAPRKSKTASPKRGPAPTEPDSLDELE